MGEFNVKQVVSGDSGTVASNKIHDNDTTLAKTFGLQWAYIRYGLNINTKEKQLELSNRVLLHYGLYVDKFINFPEGTVIPYDGAGSGFSSSVVVFDSNNDTFIWKDTASITGLFVPGVFLIAIFSGREVVSGQGTFTVDGEKFPKQQKGDPGPIGPPGADGKSGTSAYQAAISGGFQGTESEFNLTLANIGNNDKQEGIIVTQTEHTVGIYESEDGTSHDIFENVFTLTDLPQTSGEVKTYEVASVPLGFGQYIRVMDIEAISPIEETFYYGHYAVDRVFVANQRTHCILRCISSQPSCDKVYLRMRYIKYLGDKITFKVNVPDGTDANAINMSVAPLKYNKKFAFTYTADDSVEGAYARIWRRINRKWIDDIEFFHMGVKPTTGYVPDSPLVMTDGCGNDRRFGFGVALWPTWRDNWHPDGKISESSTSTTNIYITWEELRMMLDYGVSVYYHNVDETLYDKNDPAAIINGLTEDYNKTFEKLGRKMKVLALPDGNASYVEAGRRSQLIQFMRSSLSNELIYLDNCEKLYKAETYGGSHTSDITRKLQELAEQHMADNPYWVGLTSHRVSLDMMKMFETIYNLYGKVGDDSLWVASWDEIYEYVAMREGASIQKTVNGQEIVFDVYVPSGTGFYFRDLSFLMTGLTTSDGATVLPVSTNIKGLNSAMNGGKMLINVNFNKNVEALAEKYTAKYETSTDSSDKEDAVYFVSMLLPSLAAPFTARIDAVTPVEPGVISLKSVQINNGAETTTNRVISVNLQLTGTPTHYRISESENFEGAAWQTYSANNISFTLSETIGNKTVFVQLKSETMQSAVLSDSITLAASGTQIVINSLLLAAGAETTTERNVSVTIDTNIAPTHYRLSEAAELTTVEWIPYASNITCMLSEGNGLKTVYCQVKDETGESTVVSDTITLQQNVTPEKLRALMSFGWDWTSGGATGTSTYDAVLNAGKVRPTSGDFTFNIYDVDGNIIGTADSNGLKSPGATYLGNVTGDNSGIYPDELLKWTAYKDMNLPAATLAMHIPAGNYKFKIFINVGRTDIDFSAATYQIECAGITKKYELLPNFVDNFNTTLDHTLTVPEGETVTFSMAHGETGSKTLYLNLIEIEEI